MEFLKKHYEKIVLCLVLLGLGGAVVAMRAKKEEAIAAAATMQPPAETKNHPTVPPIDLTIDQQALAQITNPPPVVLSGDHNLFNPVTWKRKPDGQLMKILKTGPDALTVTSITPLNSIISYDSSMEGPIYVMTVESNVDLKATVQHQRKKTEYAKKDEKMKSGLYIVRGAKVADSGATEVNLEITATGDTNVWVSTNAPFQRVDGYVTDLKYDPESLVLTKKKVGDEIKLDNELYKIVEITNDAVRVEKERTTQVTEVKWTKSP